MNLNYILGFGINRVIQKDIQNKINHIDLHGNLMVLNSLYLKTSHLIAYACKSNLHLKQIKTQSSRTQVLMTNGLQLLKKMADTFTKEKRSQIMRAVKSQGNKSTEIKLIYLFKKYKIIGWRRNYKLFGNPDFFSTKKTSCLCRWLFLAWTFLQKD